MKHQLYCSSQSAAAVSRFVVIGALNKTKSERKKKKRRKIVTSFVNRATTRFAGGNLLFLPALPALKQHCHSHTTHAHFPFLI